MTSLCGLGGWRPEWLQRFANRKVYLAIYAVIGIIHGMLFTYFSTILSTIEKRFGLKSQEIAWVYSGNEISQAFFLLALPFIGVIKKRTLFMGLSIMVSGVGIILCGMPHVFSKDIALSHLSSDAKNDHDLCYNSATTCDKDDVLEDLVRKEKLIGVGLLFFGIFLHGIGVSFYNSFGIPYIDDNSSKTKTPLALSIVLVAKMSGPLFGSILASMFLKINQNPEKTPEILGYGENDSRWIGAWWLGFFIFGPILIIVAPLLILFPEKLPAEKGEKVEADKVLEDSPVPSNFKEWIEETKAVVLRLVKNKIYIYNLISAVSFLVGFIGFITFFPKFIEFNFRKTSSSSGLTGGASNFISSAIGILVSGCVMAKYKPKARTLSLWSIFSDILGICFFVASIFIGCSSITFQPSCGDCECDSARYLPTCSINGDQQFLSPCHAGCSHSFVVNRQTRFSNCSCISSSELIAPLLTEVDVKGADAYNSYCPDDTCSSKFIVFMSILGIFGIIGSSTRIPNLMINLRAIDPKDKATSLALTISMLSLFAFIPATVIFGSIIDSTCSLWDKDICTGENTNCLVYENSSMRLYSGLFVSIFLIITLFFDTLVWYHADGLLIYEDEEEKNKESLKTDL